MLPNPLGATCKLNAPACSFHAPVPQLFGRWEHDCAATAQAYNEHHQVG